MRRECVFCHDESDEAELEEVELAENNTLECRIRTFVYVHARCEENYLAHGGVRNVASAH